MSLVPRVRLVVAIEVGEPARAALAKAVEPLGDRYPGLRWNARDDWFVEVCALGAVEDERLGEVDEAVTEAAGANRQVALRLDGGAGVDDAGTGLFAGVEDSGALVALRGLVVGRLEERTLPVDRERFLPHCIVGRASGGARLPIALAREFRGPVVSWTAKQLLVVRTRLRLGGVVREVRSAHDLAAPACEEA